MATLERRVQVLFEAEQYEALEAEASVLRVSVGALIRESVSERLRVSKNSREDALSRLFARADSNPVAAPLDWQDEKLTFERDALRDVP